MADVSTSSQTLKIENLFVDGDTRIITLKNPKANITRAEIEDLQAFIRTNNAIIGDKYGGTFGRIESVTRITEDKTYLDLS